MTTPREYLWERIKRQVLDYILSDYRITQDKHLAAVMEALSCNSPDWKTQVDKLDTIIEQRVLNWDIRLCHHLRDCFPLAFPPELRSGPLVASIRDDEHGSWVLSRKTSP